MKWILRFWLVLLALILSAAFSFAQPIYSPVTGHWYEVDSTPRNFEDAQAYAVSKGGYLASITSAAENLWISNTFTEGELAGTKFGGNDIIQEGTWKWINGEPWSYSNWIGIEPNNGGALPEGEDVVYFTTGPWWVSGSGWGWVDYGNYLTPSLIEYDTLTPPSPEKVPVLLVHGYGGNPQDTWGDMKSLLEEAGFVVKDADYSKAPLNWTIENLASVLSIQIAQVLSETGASQIDIVAHSMGGLVTRAYMTELIGPGGRNYGGEIRRLIMTGTPNHGSAWGLLWPYAQFKGWSMVQAYQMQFGSDFIWKLNEKWNEMGLSPDQLQNILTIAGERPLGSYHANDDYVVNISSTSLSGVEQRYVPYVHIEYVLFPGTPLAKVENKDKDHHMTYKIIKEFLTSGKVLTQKQIGYEPPDFEEGMLLVRFYDANDQPVVVPTSVDNLLTKWTPGASSDTFMNWEAGSQTNLQIAEGGYNITALGSKLGFRDVRIGVSIKNAKTTMKKIKFDLPPWGVMPAEGTLGTELTIGGFNFGTKMGKVLIGSTPLTVTSWTKDWIHCRLTKTLLPGTYNVSVQLEKTTPIIYENAFTVKPAEIHSINQVEGSVYDGVTIVGKFFGTKKGKIFLEYEEDGQVVKKSCKVEEWVMDPISGDSEAVFVVPKMLPGICDVVVVPASPLPEAKEEGGFEVKAPEIESVNPKPGSVGQEITISGNYFGSKKGKVYLGYLSKGKPTKKSCSVVSWNDDQIVFVVPNLPAGSYDMIVTNSSGSTTLSGGFTIE